MTVTSLSSTECSHVDHDHMWTSIHSSLSTQGVRVLLEPLPAILGWSEGDTLDRSLVHHRVAWRQTTIFGLMCMLLDYGWKLESPERIPTIELFGRPWIEPSRLGEDMQTLHKVGNLETKPSFCEAPAVTTAPVTTTKTFWGKVRVHHFTPQTTKSNFH